MAINHPIYQVNDVQQRYGDLPVLSVRELSIPRGTIIGLAGPNGSGKSTFLRLLAFVEEMTRGEIFFDGALVELSDPSIRSRVTLLTQEAYLLRRSVFDNVLYGLKIRRDTENRRRRIAEALAWVGLPYEQFAKRQWRELSGGEAQRVALAGRLILKPRVLLLDEPTASVDAASVHLIKRASLMAREEWGTTLIIASHDWNWLYEVCDEVLHLFMGRIIGRGIQNIIFGPWSKDAHGRWGKLLSGGQFIATSPPPHENSVAVIDPRAISIFLRKPDQSSPHNLCQGTISRLSLEKRSSAVLALIAVDDLTFIAKIDRTVMRNVAVCPGEKIWIGFPQQSVHWLEDMPSHAGLPPHPHQRRYESDKKPVL